mmetsp:Transcript_51014/g.76270  ORF Transcript_51014/g.76270 Transcript_51014/m.76270 type:complete len:381 (-) Transcript_51014:203-1345(-)|eukprot:CAMPEP_0194029970 /NCGR_PEP_ID=MMETSP0009_2-20130614/3584_1 /TAXON_ID=210454 /ORGANISM="Grammatophora oceanica, Strain CCMP 410" /LENGTH=380 /DNA_ID=CAMNT_0038669807 /DNA_START=59 /DNA_END=1201 /DNA_ORIENTATION=-
MMMKKTDLTNSTKLLFLILTMFRLNGVTGYQDECWTDPAWPPTLMEYCQGETGYKPLNQLWKKQFLDSEGRPHRILESETDEDVTEDLHTCLDGGRRAIDTLADLGMLDSYYSHEALDSDDEAAWSLDELRVANSLINSTGYPVVMEIENALPPHYASALQILAACIRKHIPPNFEHREFQDGQGNDCTYVTCIVQMYLPGLVARIQAVHDFASKHAGWKSRGLPSIRDLGLRTSEHLAYGTFEKTGLTQHDDGGSIYTILFSLSDPDEYEGGEYYALDGDDKVHFKPEKFSAIVFLSETYHGVEGISWGRREMYTNEFWDLPDVPYPYNRPDRYDPRFEYFAKRGGRWGSDEEVLRYCESIGRDDCEEYMRGGEEEEEL